MASSTLRVVFSASCACPKAEACRIDGNSSQLRRPSMVASLQCQTKSSCASSASGNVERPVQLRRRPTKWLCSALESVEQGDVLLEVEETPSGALEHVRQLVEQQGGEAESADEVEMLLRFLRARSMDVEKAATAFVSHQKWRSQYVPNGGFTEADCPTELDAKKSYWIQQDRKGRPVLLTLGRNHVYNKQDFDEFTRFVVYAMDKAIAGAPSGTQNCLAIVDLKGIGMKNLDSKSFIAAFGLLQDYYPDRVDKIFMLNVPLIFNGVWKVVSNFLDEGLKKRIIFVDKKKLTETLLEEIDVEYLPKEYGGNADLLLLQDAKISK